MVYVFFFSQGELNSYGKVLIAWFPYDMIKAFFVRRGYVDDDLWLLCLKFRMLRSHEITRIVARYFSVTEKSLDKGFYELGRERGGGGSDDADTYRG